MENSILYAVKPQIRDNAGQITIGGYGAVFYDSKNPATEYRIGENYVERIARSAFDDVDFEDVRSMFNHSPDRILGRTSAGTMRIRVDDFGLYYETDLDPNNPQHMAVASSIRRGDVDGSSVWFYMAADGDEITRSDGNVVRTINRVESLLETGPVTVPAYNASTAEMRMATQKRIHDPAGDLALSDSIAEFLKNHPV